MANPPRGSSLFPREVLIVVALDNRLEVPLLFLDRVLVSVLVNGVTYAGFDWPISGSRSGELEGEDGVLCGDMDRIEIRDSGLEDESRAWTSSILCGLSVESRSTLSSLTKCRNQAKETLCFLSQGMERRKRRKIAPNTRLSKKRNSRCSQM